ncbi:PucR family transcriptional regulator [Nocardia sp. NPDC058518]|uniref:PucR family transcriptional regulator n=1 Tax=Nocardia sp. NPDC058518 TaxID=3346534 RepID=UPI0036586664
MSIEANSLAVLRMVIGQLRDPDRTSSLDGVAALAREWADQQIPLELVAHSIQLGGRKIFALIREEAGALGLPADEVDAVQGLAWDWATALSAAVYSVQQERAVVGAARRADFLRTLVQGTMPLSALAADAPRYRVDPNHLYRVACTDWDDTAMSSDILAALRTNGATTELPVIDAVIDGQLIALLPRRPDGTTRRPVGIGPATLPHEAHSSYAHACDALAIALEHGELGYVDLASLGPLPLLDSGDRAAAALDAKHLQPLREHGGAGSEILATVKAYLRLDRKVEETARHLHVHRNTIRYRLTRFTDLTGLDLDRTDDLVLAWWLLHRDR